MFKSKGRELFLVISVMFFLSCSSNSIKSDSRNPAASKGAFELDELLKISSSGNLKLKSPRVILDNRAAFESKIKAVQSAQPGDEIRLVYFIYAKDYSSSYFYRELINAAQRGVKIQLLADLFTNYKYLDVFQMLESESKGNLKVSFYGKPSLNIIRDSIFLSSPCPETKGTPSITQCSDFKWNNLDQKNPDFYAQTLLSGMYSKNIVALSTGFLMGQQIDPSKFKRPKTAESEADLEDLKEFFNNLYRAKVKGELTAKLKVALALAFYGEELNPVLNELFGHIPLSQMGQSSVNDWEHLTDYTHHKLILVKRQGGSYFFQLGGRNIEDSYHMKPIPGVEKYVDKYIFIDTDFAAEVISGGEGIEQAYQRMWNFEPMVTSLAEVYRLMPNDFVVNAQRTIKTVPSATEKAIGACQAKQQITRDAFKNCFETTIQSVGFKNLTDRIALEKQSLNQNADKYLKYISDDSNAREPSMTWNTERRNYSDVLSGSDTRELDITYIENVVKAEKITEKNNSGRKYSVVSGQELAFGKNIHYAWMRGLENACEVGRTTGREQRVVLHTAYLIFPIPLLTSFKKMMDGTWDCSKVKVSFLTNSIATTDLNLINVFAKYQTYAFFHVYATRKGQFGEEKAKRSAQFEFYEYKPSLTKPTSSLHTKLSILGEDVIIGSANADVRSYSMDTNNGIYLKDAREFVNNYLKFIDGLLADETRTTNLTNKYIYLGNPDETGMTEAEKAQNPFTLDKLYQEDKEFIDAIADRYAKKYSAEKKAALKAKILELKKTISMAILDFTEKTLNHQYIVAYPQGEYFDQSELERSRMEEQKKIYEKMTELLKAL